MIYLWASLFSVALCCVLALRRALAFCCILSVVFLQASSALLHPYRQFAHTVEPRFSGLFDYPDFFSGPVFFHEY